MSNILSKKTTIHNMRRIGRFLLAGLALVCFISTLYTPMAYASGQGLVVLTVEQTLTGGDLSSQQNQDFSYRLTAISGAPLPDGSSAQSYVFTIKGTDDAKVGPIAFRTAGTYKYELSCEIDSDDSVQSFDRQVYTISVYVTDDLSSFVVVGKDNGEKAAQIMFAHTLVSWQEPPPIYPEPTPQPTPVPETTPGPAPQPTPVPRPAPPPTPAPIPVPAPVITPPVTDDAPPDEGEAIAPNEPITDDEINQEDNDGLIEEPNPPIIEIEDDETPLGLPGVITTWALMNLILTLAGIALAIMIGVKSLIKKKHGKEDIEQYGAPYGYGNKNKRHSRLVLILAIPLLAVVGILIFLLTQDMRLPMVTIDWWTLAHAILLTCGILSYIFAYSRDKDSDDEKPASHTGAA